MPKNLKPLDNVIRQLARNRANKVRQAFADNPSNRYSVMKQMEDDLIGELTPMLTRTWEPSMRRGPRGFHDILNSGKFKNQLETRSAAGAYDPSGRRYLSYEYFYGPRPENVTDLEKYGYLKRPKKADGEDDVDFYGKYDIRFKPDVRKHMTVNNGDSYNEFHAGHLFHGTPIVPSDPETYINWVAAPDNFDAFHDGNPKWATEELFDKVLDDLKTYHRPTFRPRNMDYIEAQYHGPLTLNDVEKVSVPNGWFTKVEGKYELLPVSEYSNLIRDRADEYGFQVLDEDGKCIYNCR